MGIDVYLRWDDQTDAEQKAQITGFDIHSGNVGYLREAYHGGPYATKVLVPEAFDYDGEDGKPYKAAMLRKRLPATIQAAIERSLAVYQERITEKHKTVRAFVEFVELAEQKEAEGKKIRVRVSA